MSTSTLHRINTDPDKNSGAPEEWHLLIDYSGTHLEKPNIVFTRKYYWTSKHGTWRYI